MRRSSTTPCRARAAAARGRGRRDQARRARACGRAREDPSTRDRCARGTRASCGSARSGRLGHETTAVDLSADRRASRSRFARRVQWRLRMGSLVRVSTSARSSEALATTRPDVLWVDKVHLRAAGASSTPRALQGVRWLVHYLAATTTSCSRTRRDICGAGLRSYDLVVTTKRLERRAARLRPARRRAPLRQRVRSEMHRPIVLRRRARSARRRRVASSGRWEPRHARRLLDAVAALPGPARVRGPGWERTRSRRSCALPRASRARSTATTTSRAIAGAKVNLGPALGVGRRRSRSARSSCRRAARFMLAERTGEHRLHFADGAGGGVLRRHRRPRSARSRTGWRQTTRGARIAARRTARAACARATRTTTACQRDPRRNSSPRARRGRPHDGAATHLVYRCGALGDTIVALPAIRAVRRGVSRRRARAQRPRTTAPASSGPTRCCATSAGSRTS